MLIDADNPYQEDSPRRLELTLEDFSFSLSGANRQALGRTAPWSIVGYLAADCNLAPLMFEDLKEMKAVGSGDELHVMALFDGPLLTDAFFARLNRDSKLSQDLITRYGELNTHKPEVLTLALQLAGLFPGEKRVLFLGGHGQGWRGALLDENRGLRRYQRDPGWLRLPGTYQECFRRLERCNRQVQEELHRRPPAPAPAKPYDILAFDACDMGNIEAVAALAEQADLLVVTEDQMPGQGFPYGRVLAALTRNPEQPPEAFCRLLVQETKDFYHLPARPRSRATQVALRSRRLPEVIAALRHLAETVSSLLDRDAAVRQAARYALDMTWHSPATDSIDLKDMVLNLTACPLPGEVRQAAEAFLDAWPGMVVAASAPEGSGGRHGVSIYAPRPERFDPAYLRLADTLPYGLSSWSWFLAHYYLQVLGEEAPRHPLIRVLQDTMEEMMRQGLYHPPSHR